MRKFGKKTGFLAIVLGLAAIAALGDRAMHWVYPTIDEVRYGGMEDASRLIAFVGQAQDVRRIEHEPCGGCFYMDERYRARYRVLQQVYGHLEGRDIAFEAYDHYGRPAFANHDTVLLFVSRTWSGRYVHQKYLFYPVFRTRDGQWAGCGKPYQRKYQPPVDLEPRVLAYGPDATLPVGDRTPEEIAEDYPAPYFRIDGKWARCLMGNTVEELFDVTRRGILSARGMRNWK